MENKTLLNWLFETKAIRVSPEKKPFWYTSGTIGPYYINTHFLYGSEEKANDLLEKIDFHKNDKLSCPGILLKMIKTNYKSDFIFKGLIDSMVDYIKKNIKMEAVDYISGGERRDWFFSLIAAEMLDKPHIMIFKDLTAVLTEKGITKEMPRINGAGVLHIADLITEASSYERAWIPAVRSFGGNIAWSVVVIDRKQGGEELLSSNGVKSFAMAYIDNSLFMEALEMKLINQSQFDMLSDYAKNPKECMKQFLKEYPEFMENSLKADAKTAERARLCIEKRFYE
ncbi:MAG: orotate phosphoribosyltransferase [Ruminiclostridium sp.]|nr:orotate phosphoribosyltransferase [Ruminiclostridium sp.]